LKNIEEAEMASFLKKKIIFKEKNHKESEYNIVKNI
jgi:hypothetical protein